MATAGSRTTVVVSESFDITNRGAAAVFEGPWESIPVGRPLHVVITPPDGAAFHARAFMELILRRSRQPVELGAVLVCGRSKHDVPAGTQIELPLADGRAAPTLAEIVGAFLQVPLPPGWHHDDSPELTAELAREVVRGHLLFGEEAQALASAEGSDDVLFATRLVGAPLVAVHLTYRQETSPTWPNVTPFPSIEAWRQSVQDLE